jgi:hypothetical protein
MGLDELEAAWNAKADRDNQWQELGIDEIVAFAQEVERKACAKVCRDLEETGTEPTGELCAMAIEMRSNA